MPSISFRDQEAKGGICLQLGESRIWLGQGKFKEYAPSAPYICFQTPEIKYIPWNDDFGPMNVASIVQFIEILDSYIEIHPDKDIIYVADGGPRNLTNAAFLLGAYMVLKQDVPSREINRWFDRVEYREFGKYNDASSEPNSFRLSLVDCWRALEKVNSLRWFCKPDQSGMWGAMDPEEYSHFDCPLEGNIHVVIPDRMLAFHGPKHLRGAREYIDDLQTGYRTFSPKYYIDIFQSLGVTTIVRLNQSYYDKHEFEVAGFRHFDLPFLDGTWPSEDVINNFFLIIQSTAGMVAVHCSSGLGRTGTLVALCLMRDHGFSAREAMGWLRIVRPGSVLGEQQEFLCDTELRYAAHPPSTSRSRVRARAISPMASRPLPVIPELVRHSPAPTVPASPAAPAAASPRSPLGSAHSPDPPRRRPLTRSTSFVERGPGAGPDRPGSGPGSPGGHPPYSRSRPSRSRPVGSRMPDAARTPHAEDLPASPPRALARTRSEAGGPADPYEGGGGGAGSFRAGGPAPPCGSLGALQHTTSFVRSRAPSAVGPGSPCSPPSAPSR